MPQITHRANLSAAIFPMTLADAGRSVINPQSDSNYDRRVDPSGEQKDAGIPQAIYLENVIPTANGYQSVGWSERLPLPPRSAGVGSLSAYKAFVVEDTVFLAREGTAGYVDVVSNVIGCTLTWQYNAGATPLIPSPSSSTSIASVRGTNYYCDRTSLFTFTIDPVTKQLTFTDVTGSVTGITVASIRYICSAYNYLIALHDDGTIYWSSTTTPTDFTASLVTGAGSETPGNDIDAQFLIENPAGFIVFGTHGATLAQYTGNSRYPWKFTPIGNCGGYTYTYQVWGNKESAATYCIDNGNKVRIISGGEAQLVAPEISTYLERKNYHDVFDTATDTFSRSDPFNIKKIHYALDRYLLVSVIEAGTSANSYAFLYDTLLQRYGKIKQDHQFVAANETTVTFLPAKDWSVVPEEFPYTLSFDVYSADYVFAGVILLGKFQYIRDRLLQLEQVSVESATDADVIPQNFSLTLLPSMDGKNFTTPVALTCTYANELVTAPVHKTAKNHSILIKGAFDINTLQLEFNVTGDR